MAVHAGSTLPNEGWVPLGNTVPTSARLSDGQVETDNRSGSAPLAVCRHAPKPRSALKISPVNGLPITPHCTTPPASMAIEVAMYGKPCTKL